MREQERSWFRKRGRRGGKVELELGLISTFTLELFLEGQLAPFLRDLKGKVVVIIIITVIIVIIEIITERIGVVDIIPPCALRWLS